MNDKICWLVSVLYKVTLLKCAIIILRVSVSADCAEYPMMPENRAYIHGFLPAHVKSCGPIVDIEEIFEVYEAFHR